MLRAGLWVAGGLVVPSALGAPLGGNTSWAAQPSSVIPPAMGNIAQLSYDESACAGCGTCEEVCALVHSEKVGPPLRRLWVEREPFAGYTVVATCQQCADPLCYQACPVGALYIDAVTGARCIDESSCVGCRRCYHACPMDPPRINFDPVRRVSLKCDLCKDRPEGPACVQFCPQEALTLNSKVNAHG